MSGACSRSAKPSVWSRAVLRHEQARDEFVLERIGELLGQLGDVVVGHRRELLAHDLLRGLDGRAVHRRRGVGHFPDAEHDEMRSTSGRGLQGSKRSFDDSPRSWPRRTVPPAAAAAAKPASGLRQGFMFTSRIAGSPCAIEAEIDARIARQREQVPAGEREVFELGGKLGVLGFKTEAARRADIGRRCRASIWRRSRRSSARGRRSPRTRFRRWAARAVQTVRRAARD